MKRPARVVHALYRVAHGSSSAEAKHLGLSIRQYVKRFGHRTGKAFRRGTPGAFGKAN